MNGPAVEKLRRDSLARPITLSPRDVMQDHDLPVLGAELSPRVRPDWEALLACGVQPALMLGAERRWQGRR